MAVNESRVYFALLGDDFEPDDLTNFLGITPTSVSRKGSKTLGKIPACSSWQLSTENIANNYIDVFEMSASIINQLKPKKQLILDAIIRFNLSPLLEVVLWITVNEDHSTPAIGFDIDTIKFLGEIGASIDIDTYKH